MQRASLKLLGSCAVLPAEQRNPTLPTPLPNTAVQGDAPRLVGQGERSLAHGTCWDSLVKLSSPGCWLLQALSRGWHQTNVPHCTVVSLTFDPFTVFIILGQMQSLETC